MPISEEQVEPSAVKIGRRRLLQQSIAGAAAWSLGLAAADVSSLETMSGEPEGADSGSRFTEVLRIYRDNRVVIVPPAAEMGQNVITTLAALVAEELDIDWSAVEVEVAPHHSDFYNARGQAVGNSRSIRIWYEPLRRLGAAARQALLESAADLWRVSIENLATERGFVLNPVTGERLSYGELSEAAARKSLSDSPPLRSSSQWRLLGRTLARKDGVSKVTGAAQFGADIRLPGMVYAAIRMAPDPGGSLSFEPHISHSQAGVILVTQIEGAVAVVADRWWRAHSVLAQTKTNALPGPWMSLDEEAIARAQNAALGDERGTIAYRSGNPLSRIDDAWIEASYDQPYLAHACLETMTATVSVTPDRVVVFAPTQSPKRSAERVAELLNRPLEQVEMFNTYLGGGFGRKGLDFGATLQAARLSQIVGRPVQVIWDRQTDFEQDQFRPGARYLARAKLDAEGYPSEMELRIATQSLRKQLFPGSYRPEGVELSDTPLPYNIPNIQVRWSEVDLPIRVGFWRAVYSSAHPFAIESFIDELATTAQQDPYQYRQRLLAHNSRLLATLDHVAAMAQWGQPRTEGRAVGIACIEGWGSFCAQVAEVAVDGAGWRVSRIWVAADCGRVLCPGTVEAQLQGAVAYAMSSVLGARMRFAEGAGAARNFDSYPVLRLSQMPEVSVSLIASEADPGGVGELGVPCCAPAIANAIAAAGGERPRSVPFPPQTKL